MLQKKKKIKKSNEFYQKAFARNLGFFTPEEQEKLKTTRIAIAGLGGVGGVYLLNLGRAGITKFNIADFDSFELANINRQAGANIESLDKPKIKVMAEMAKSINPFASIKVFPKGINQDNIDQFLKGVKVVLDGLDFFNIKDRLLLFRKAREHNLYAITSPPIGFGASLLVFSPQGMSFEEYFDIKDEMKEEEKLLSFGLGLSPALIHTKYFKPTSIDFSQRETPSLVMGTLLCANLVISEAIKIILNKKIKAAPFSIQFDPYLQKYKKVFLRKGNRNLSQRLKRWFVKRKLAQLGKI